MSQPLQMNPQLVIDTSRERLLLLRNHALRDEGPHRLAERLGVRRTESGVRHEASRADQIGDSTSQSAAWIRSRSMAMR